MERLHIHLEWMQFNRYKVIKKLLLLLFELKNVFKETFSLIYSDVDILQDSCSEYF